METTSTDICCHHRQEISLTIQQISMIDEWLKQGLDTEKAYYLGVKEISFNELNYWQQKLIFESSFNDFFNIVNCFVIWKKHDIWQHKRKLFIHSIRYLQ